MLTAILQIRSLQITTKIQWFKSPPLLIWLLCQEDSEDSIQISIWLQFPWASTTWTDLGRCLHTWCINNKCRCRCTSNQWQTASQCLLELKVLQIPHHLQVDSLSTRRQDLLTKMVKGTRRRTKTTPLKSQAVRRATRLSQKNTWPSKRKIRAMSLQPRPPLIKSQSKT